LRGVDTQEYGRVTRRFRGESIHKVDQKGRVSVPAPFRRVLEEGDPDWQPGANPNLVLIYGFPGRPRLEGYTMEGVANLDAAVSRMPRFSKRRAIMERFLNTKSVYAQVDENGRLVLSAKLRDTVGLSDEAVFAGMGEHFQVWAPDTFENDDADLAAALAEIGGDDATENVFAILDGEDTGGDGA
jgi:MraZ protein